MFGFRFSEGKLILNRMDDVATYRRRSRGWHNDLPAYIHPRILFGSGIAIDEEFVEKYNITHVINCAFDEDSPKWFRQKHPKKYVSLQAPDDLTSNILDWYPQFEQTMQKFLSENNSKTVYVHCQCGINRSGFLCLAYACKRLRFDYNEVVKSILTQRPCALTNPNYRKQVRTFSGAS
jgi:hypothetical protein